MKKMLKLTLLCSLLLCGFSGSAQSKLKNYLDAEKERIQKAQYIETEIAKFISKKINGYVLQQSVIDKIVAGEKDSGISGIDLKSKLEDAKKRELRKLYFANHPEIVNQYNAIPIPVSLRQTCINGDFETNPGVNFTFWSEQIASNTECAVNPFQIVANAITPTINDFTSLATVFDSTDSSWNAATMQFDQYLNSLAIPVQIPTISPNGGSRSIKLNNNSGGNDVTTMSRQMLIDDPTLEYEFSLMLQASGHLATQEEPIFTVRIYDLNGNLIQQRCIISQPDCIFNVAGNGGRGGSNDVFYTNWICDRIDVSALVDDPVVGGVNAIVEFTIADCGQGGHYGTVYIDNLCNFTCNNPAFGIVTVTPQEDDCPSASSLYQICGTYSMPTGSTLNSLALQYSIDQGVTFIPLTAPIATLSTNVIDGQNGTFCFTIQNSFFNNSLENFRYIFQVIESYTQTCAAGTFNNTNTTLAVIDLTNCCLSDLTLTSPSGNMDNNMSDSITKKERHEWIKASNIIGVGNTTPQDGVVYHAGHYVELRTGFEARYNSKFAAYVQDCGAPDFVYKNQSSGRDDVAVDNNDSDDLIKVLSSFNITPNPSNSFIDLNIKNDTFNKISIITIDGRMVFDKTIETTNSYNLDISQYASGVYIVNVISVTGKQYSQKLIKN